MKVDKWITRIENVFSGMRDTIKCWFSSNSSSRLLCSQLNSPYNFPFFHIVLVATLGADVALNIKIRLKGHILEDMLAETKKIINL